MTERAKRLTFELGENGQEVIQEIGDRTGSKAQQVMLDAVNFWDWVTEVVASGRKIYAIDPETNDKVEMVTPSLKAIERRKKSVSRKAAANG
jgi:hypothetical protein